MDTLGLSLGWVDLVLLGVLLLSTLVGVVRGLVFEMLSVLGWVAAYFAAQWLTPQVAPCFPVGEAGSALNHGAAFAIAFIGALIVWGLAARLLRLLIRATPLSLLDRLLGAGFGFARGVIVLLALATVIGLMPLKSSPAWQQSVGAAWLQSVLRGLKPVLPPELSKHLPA
ncbi:MAG: colicin V synthesis protein [Methylibium sp. NZG]|nr:MAG: colicin V synthesis protein [Methylibium sp. NZG]